VIIAVWRAVLLVGVVWRVVRRIIIVTRVADGERRNGDGDEDEGGTKD
jgi:hypothetical protein